MKELPRSEDVFNCIDEMRRYYKSHYYVPSVDEMKARLAEKTKLKFGPIAGEGSTSYDRLINTVSMHLSVLQRDLDRELSAQVEYLENLEEAIKDAMRRCRSLGRPRIPHVLSHYCDISAKDIAESIVYMEWFEACFSELREVAKFCKSIGLKCSLDFMQTRTGLHPSEIKYFLGKTNGTSA